MSKPKRQAAPPTELWALFDYLNSDPALRDDLVDRPVPRCWIPGEAGVDFDVFDMAERNGWGSPTTMFCIRVDLAQDAHFARVKNAKWDEKKIDSEHERSSRLASTMQPASPFSIAAPDRRRVFIWQNAVHEWLSTSGRLRDVWCCPTCRHFFLATHARQCFCTPACMPERQKATRDRAAYMRKYRKARAALKKGKARARARARRKAIT